MRSPSPRFGQSSWILLHFAHLLKLIASGSWIVSSPARRCSAKLPYSILVCQLPLDWQPAIRLLNAFEF